MLIMEGYLYYEPFALFQTLLEQPHQKNKNKNLTNNNNNNNNKKLFFYTNAYHLVSRP